MIRAERYCCEDISKIENYELAKKDNFKGWCCHHRLETHNSDSERRAIDMSQKELLALDMYYDRPANELIFMKQCEHTYLHHIGKPKPKSELARKHISEAQIGKKGKPMTEENKKILSERMKGNTFGKANKGRTSPNKGIPMSEEQKQKISSLKWWNNGVVNKRSVECPEGFVAGRLPHFTEQSKERLSKARKGKHMKLVDGKRVYY